MPPANPFYNSLPAFHARLLTARRILALCGAGLSASSGLPTFRGAGGYWRNHEATALATPEAFAADPGLVWLFYAYRRHMALGARPNAGHRALAELARKGRGRGKGQGEVDFLCLSQNVDGLHQRAGHDAERLRLLHGSLFDLKCHRCDWVERGNFDDPLCDSLRAASEDVGLERLLDPKEELAGIPREELPHCPKCKIGLQRPGVVWFGESLDAEMLREVDRWIDEDEVDVVLVIGTSAVVQPAAGYVYEAQGPGTSIVTVNLDAENVEALAELGPRDFAFAGDAAELLPKLLEPVIGRMKEDGTFGAEE